MTTTIARSANSSLQRTFLVAVAGNPNCGKTTVFNALTGLRHKVGNYSGVTVEKREGVMLGDPSIRLLDLPGAYSLSAHSPDEMVARDVLLGLMSDTGRLDAVLIVVDAGNLERNLYLATQVLDLGLPAVIACNMMDVLREAGHTLDVEKLSQRLGAPVIPTVGARAEGIDALHTAIRLVCRTGSTVEAEALSAGDRRVHVSSDADRGEARVSTDQGTDVAATAFDPPPPPARRWNASECIDQAIACVAAAIRESGQTDASAARGLAALLLAEDDISANHWPPSVKRALADARDRLAAEQCPDPGQLLTCARYAWLSAVVNESLQRSPRNRPSMTDRLDRVLTHRVWGLAIFAPMMALLFYSIFTLATPLMALIEDGISLLQNLITAAMPAGVLRDLLTDGVLAGAGNVLAFFPQICILFLFIALLEDTGYMARAAFLMNRIMSRVGLHGKSFIPLLSSHACAVPGIMATRTIENPRDRLVTILVAPLMGCSARLPVYTVLIAACLPGAAWLKATVLLTMYGLGVLTALAMATLFKKTLLRGPTPGFLIELPPYRVPRLTGVFRAMWDRSQLFLTQAGTIILAMTIVLWALMSFPKSAERAAWYDQQRAAVAAADAAVPFTNAEQQLAALDQAEAAENLQNSIVGRLGRGIEPAIKPLGYDWKIGVGIIASLAAREVFVGTMGVVYSVGEADEESKPLRQQMREATWPDGSRVFTPLVAVGLMIFYVLACQCVSTLAVVKRETNSWRWPLFMFGYMSVLAYVAALLVYQVGSAFQIGTGQ